MINPALICRYLCTDAFGRCCFLKLLSREIKDEEPAALRPRPHACLCKSCQRKTPRIIGFPVQTIVEAVFTFCNKRHTWQPEGHNVIVDFLLGWDLHETNFAFAPIPYGLYPEGGSSLVMGLQILISAEIPLTLDQSKTAWIRISKRTDLKVNRIGELSP